LQARDNHSEHGAPRGAAKVQVFASNGTTPFVQAGFGPAVATAPRPHTARASGQQLARQRASPANGVR
jgi:hypothetical protein